MNINNSCSRVLKKSYVRVSESSYVRGRSLSKGGTQDTGHTQQRGRATARHTHSSVK